jgi:N-acetylmuramoyl-L-alanine amidase
MKKSICITALVAAALGAALSPVPSVAAPTPDIAGRLAGRVVFLDPGHQGGGTPAQLNRLVDNGRGGVKPCQTTGMTALGGMPEHTITWRVAQYVKTSLESLGAKVVLSRPDDTGWGGCITDRARAANASGADIAVSIHADGAPAADHGFHFIVPQRPIPNPVADRVQSTKGLAATTLMRDAYLHAGFSPANYAGAVDGLQTRSDVAGPALTTVPDVFVEMGNGANPADAAQLTSPHGQLQHAMAITTGLVGYLLGVRPGGGEQVAAPNAAAPDAAAPNPTAPNPTGPNVTDPAATPGVTTPDPSLAQPQTGTVTPGQGATDTHTPGLVESLLISVGQLVSPLLETLGIHVPDVAGLVGSASDLVGKLLAELISG